MQDVKVGILIGYDSEGFEILECPECGGTTQSGCHCNEREEDWEDGFQGWKKEYDRGFESGRKVGREELAKELIDMDLAGPRMREALEKELMK
jgi:hypothetical protein